MRTTGPHTVGVYERKGPKQVTKTSIHTHTHTDIHTLRCHVSITFSNEITLTLTSIKVTLKVYDLRCGDLCFVPIWVSLHSVAV